MEELTDAQLIQACRSGHHAALGVLFTRYLKGAYGYVVRLIGSEEAEDVVQESFVKAWRHLKSFDPEKPFRPWLYRIVHNTALDLIRKKRPFSFSDLEEGDSPSMEENIQDENPLPSEWMERAETSKELAEQLAILPLKQRSVLLLYYEEDLTFAEIGAVLKESLNTVKSRHRRAIQALRAAMSTMHHNETPKRTTLESL